jgi:RHS repeat-associated protein
MKFRTVIIGCAAILLLILTFPLYPGNIIRKEVKVYDTFDAYKKDKPFKVYPSEAEYNSDTKIKNDTSYIKKIIITNTQDPRKNGVREIIPKVFLKAYENYVGINNRDAKHMNKVIALYDSVDRLNKRVAIKLFKSKNCERDLEKDLNTIFKGRKDLIIIVYRFNKFNERIMYEEHKIPASHLTQYLGNKVDQGKLSMRDALEIKSRKGELKTIWYDHNKNLIRERKVNQKPGANKSQRLAKTKRKSPINRRPQFKGFGRLIPPPNLNSIETQNQYLIEMSLREYNRGKPLEEQYILPSSVNNPINVYGFSHINKRKRGVVQTKNAGVSPSVLVRTSPKGQREAYNKSEITPLIAASTISQTVPLPGSTASQPSETVITTDVNNLNQYTRFGNWSLVYDKNGNTIQKGTQKFAYDFKNNLVRYTDLTTEALYQFDTFNRRLEKSVNGKTTKYYYDSQFQVIEERDGNDTVLKQYVYGNQIDDVISVKIYQGSHAGTYYYHTDATGSVTAVVDQEGRLIERVSYDTYGIPTFKDYLIDPQSPVTRDYSIIDNEILWQGRRYDPESNMYYYRNRTYDPTMGRFLQTDPMGYQDSMNLYQGMGMNPVNFVDPMGEHKMRKILGPGSSIIHINSPTSEELEKGVLEMNFSYKVGDNIVDVPISQHQGEAWAFQAKLGNPLLKPLFEQFYGISSDQIKDSAFKLWLKSFSHHKEEIVLSALGSYWAMAEANAAKKAGNFAKSQNISRMARARNELDLADDLLRQVTKKAYIPKDKLVGKRYGHTWDKHGSHNTHELLMQAKLSGDPQGQWLKDAAVEEFIAERLHLLKNGAKTFELPPGLGRIIYPDGTVSPATIVRLVPSKSGVKTAYPIIN